jgi:hypothetical protein
MKILFVTLLRKVPPATTNLAMPNSGGTTASSLPAGKNRRQDLHLHPLPYPNPPLMA